MCNSKFITISNMIETFERIRQSLIW